MALTVETKTIRPKLGENGILYIGVEVTIKDGSAILAVETFTEAATPGEDVTKYGSIFKDRTQALLDRCDIESKLSADVKYTALAAAAKDSVKVKGT